VPDRGPCEIADEQAVATASSAYLTYWLMQVNLHDAKTRLSELVAAAEKGEDVIIARDGTPAVRLVAVAVEHPPVRLGVLNGEIELRDDFDDALPEFLPYST
jgi:prevent-host-death family protein